MADSPILFALQCRLKQRKFWRARCYTVTLRSIVPKSTNTDTTYAIIPIPRSTPYQSLVSNVTISPASLQSTLKTDDSNQFLVIANDMHKTDALAITVHCSVVVQARRPRHSANTFVLDDYAPTDKPHHSKGEPEITRIASFVLNQSHGNVLQTANIAYEYVVGRLQYGNPSRGLYSAQQALRDNCVDCGGFSSLLVALYQACGIPARIVAGYWTGYSNNNMHAWMEWMLPDETWIANDPSTDYLRRQRRTYKTGGFMNVGSDRITISQGTNINIPLLNTSVRLDILQTPVQILASGKVHYIENYTFYTS